MKKLLNLLLVIELIAITFFGLFWTKGFFYTRYVCVAMSLIQLLYIYLAKTGIRIVLERDGSKAEKVTSVKRTDNHVSRREQIPEAQANFDDVSVAEQTEAQSVVDDFEETAEKTPATRYHVKKTSKSKENEVLDRQIVLLQGEIKQLTEQFGDERSKLLDCNLEDENVLTEISQKLLEIEKEIKEKKQVLQSFQVKKKLDSVTSDKYPS